MCVVHASWVVDFLIPIESTDRPPDRPPPHTNSPQLGRRLLHGLSEEDFLSEDRTTQMRPAIFSLVNTVVGGGACPWVGGARAYTTHECLPVWYSVNPFERWMDGWMDGPTNPPNPAPPLLQGRSPWPTPSTPPAPWWARCCSPPSAWPRT